MRRAATRVVNHGTEAICTMSKVFFDTNVLVYAADKDFPEKRKKAKEILSTYATRAVISTQVVQEFYVASTKKLGIDPHKAKAIIRTFESFETVPLYMEDIYKAIDYTILWQISFWDTLIIVAAEKANCSTIYSEDLNSGQKYGRIKLINPFL